MCASSVEVVAIHGLQVVGVDHLRVRKILDVVSIVVVTSRRIALARPVAIVPITMIVLGSVLIIHTAELRVRPIHVIVLVPAELRLRSVTVVDMSVLLLPRPVLVVALSVVRHIEPAALAAPKLVEAGVVAGAANGLDRREVAPAVVAVAEAEATAMAVTVIREMAAVVRVVLVVLAVFVMSVA